jgi:mannosyl-3-phosphoglycerate phosphatase
MPGKPQLIVFTDLDGTLLDQETYSWEAARPGLEALRSQNVPLILSSSKTREELAPIRRDLESPHPFIVENGGAVYIPEIYFTVPLPDTRTMKGYLRIELGVPYSLLRRALASIRRETGIALLGYGDLDLSEIRRLTGLPEDEARRSQAREYDEPFLIEAPATEHQTVLDRIHAMGFQWTKGGRFYHLSGKHDKGVAVRILSDLYGKQHGAVRTVALGDSANDLPMLLAVDEAVIVQRPDGSYLETDLKTARRTDGIGPVGWNEAILSLLK